MEGASFGWDAEGRPARDFPSPEAMAEGDEEMACGGCAAKVGPSALQDALARLPQAPPDASVRLGLEQADDTAAFETQPARVARQLARERESDEELGAERAVPADQRDAQGIQCGAHARETW